MVQQILLGVSRKNLVAVRDYHQASFLIVEISLFISLGVISFKWFSSDIYLFDYSG